MGWVSMLDVDVLMFYVCCVIGARIGEWLVIGDLVTRVNGVDVDEMWWKMKREDQKFCPRIFSNIFFIL